MLPDYSADQLQLPAMASWPASVHLFDSQQRLALRAAEAAGRPLLVRGDPGTGKSQLAHAAAVAAGRLFLPVVVDARTEASDLQWHFDAVARLADAHLRGLAGGEGQRSMSARNYVCPGPLWWAFDWASASEQCRLLEAAPTVPKTPDGWAPERGSVVLIDEIDKAEAELPNGLLEVLGNGGFHVPLAQTTVQRSGIFPAPLVIITTNEERELPAPFLRRCLVLNLKLPQGDALQDYLLARGRLHFPDLAKDRPDCLQQAAQLLLDDRQSAQESGAYLPGLAEYLDLLRALQKLDSADPMALLKELRRFVYVKHSV
jgi:MoxR-like ATPase